MIVVTPYCGAPALPGTLWARFNLDPVLVVALVLLAALHTATAKRDDQRKLALAGWSVVAGALLSPLCALSVSLFAARIGQHMLLLLIAAPLIGASLPRWPVLGSSRALWTANLLFLFALWFWHMPAPYAATFASSATYWAMHISLFAIGTVLWATLLRKRSPAALVAGMIASIQMGLLGAVICLASWPMYAPHYLTTEAWGLTPLADQQLGGVLMWVPGCLLFLWVAMRSLVQLWRLMDEAPA